MNEILKQTLDRLLREKDRVLVALEGPCTAGKTTLAAQMEREYDCNVFHMDDFFLRPHQRTGERLSQPGGNVDYERFREEVLDPLLAGKSFSFRPYDCSTGQLSSPVAVEPKKLNIIEGTYSHHPFFGDRYDLRLFLAVSPETQRSRVLARPAFLHDRFFGEWIPMEEQYFAAFSVREQSDFVLEEEM